MSDSFLSIIQEMFSSDKEVSILYKDDVVFESVMCSNLNIEHEIERSSVFLEFIFVRGEDKFRSIHVDKICQIKSGDKLVNFILERVDISSNRYSIPRIDIYGFIGDNVVQNIEVEVTEPEVPEIKNRFEIMDLND
ncbi:MAG: hypothetical protein J7L15_06580 [Clostridiales bacterium]|nr:hypothetical protein [Clostridiales bacterium]